MASQDHNYLEAKCQLYHVVAHFEILTWAFSWQAQIKPSFFILASGFDQDENFHENLAQMR